MRKILASILLSFFALITLASPSFALTKSGETIIIPQGQTVNETLYASGESIKIQGTVNGDVMCAGNSIRVEGLINGDLLCAGQTITVTGLVNGNIRSAGEALNLEGQVTRNVMFFGQTLTQTTQSIVNGEMFLGAQNTTIDGTVGKKVTGGVDKVALNGFIGSADISGTRVTVGPSASISGNLTYSSDNEAQIDPGASISGVITQQPPKVNGEEFKEAFAKIAGAIFLVWKITMFIMLLTAAILVAWIFPKFSQAVITSMTARPLNAILWGLALFVGSCIVIVLLAATIVGIPLAILAFIVFSLIGFLARIMVAIFVGDFIMRKVRKAKTPLVLSAIIGVFASWILYQIPVLGILVSIIAGFWSLGALLTTLREKRKSF